MHFNAAAFGFEYTLYQWRNSERDLGLLMEYLYDGRDEFNPPTNFNNDVFVGSRLAFNDTRDTALLFGVIVDAENNETLVNLELQTRLSAAFTLEMESRIFVNPEENGGFAAFANDSYLELKGTWHF
jgi:hypothetical protein